MISDDPPSIHLQWAGNIREQAVARSAPPQEPLPGEGANKRHQHRERHPT